MDFKARNVSAYVYIYVICLNDFFFFFFQVPVLSIIFSKAHYPFSFCFITVVIYLSCFALVMNRTSLYFGTLVEHLEFEARAHMKTI